MVADDVYQDDKAHLFHHLRLYSPGSYSSYLGRGLSLIGGGLGETDLFLLSGMEAFVAGSLPDVLMQVEGAPTLVLPNPPPRLLGLHPFTVLPLSMSTTTLRSINLLPISLHVCMPQTSLPLKFNECIATGLALLVMHQLDIC